MCDERVPYPDDNDVDIDERYNNGDVDFDTYSDYDSDNSDND